MAYNGSGDYSLPAGQPVVTGTVISSTTHNTLASDVATAFDTAFCRDGQAAATAAWDLGGFRIQNMGVATGVAHAVTAAQVQNNSMTLLASVAGTNTITGSATPNPAAYASGQTFIFIPANTNTGSTTLNVSSLGAKNVFSFGAACVAGEIIQNVPCIVEYDGTQFNIVSQVRAIRGDLRLTTDGSILDSSGNELVKFTKTASAVNELTIVNAAASGEPEINATGNDTDIDIILRAKGAGNIKLGAGALDLSGSSAGYIKFPAAQTASADANTLDDYEEGTFTPNIGGNATYNAQIGVYTKIARLVLAQWTIAINTIGTGSATTLSGLPFAVTGTVDQGWHVHFFSGVVDAVRYICGITAAAGSSITFNNTAAADLTTITSTMQTFQNSTIVKGSGHYTV